MLGIAAQIIALGLLLTLTCLALGSGSATSLGGRIGSWKTEPGVSPPNYAVTEPIESNLNVDTVVLLCSETARGRLLELDLYLSKPHFLVPNGADQRSLKDDPSVEIIVDGRTFNADLLFADGYVVVADATDHRQPFLSKSLLGGPAAWPHDGAALRFLAGRCGSVPTQPARGRSAFRSRSDCCGETLRGEVSRHAAESTALDAGQWTGPAALLGCDKSRGGDLSCRR
jgi:hypothetical protein